VRIQFVNVDGRRVVQSFQGLAVVSLDEEDQRYNCSV
jgi:hypothetical protein